jgi:hypothetical protein
MLKVIAAALGLLFGCAHAQSLEGRDINGDGTFDAYYDSAQNISWLADANYFATQGNPIQNYPGSSSPSTLEPGQMSWITSVGWVGNLSVFGVEGWRLPQRFVPAGGPSPGICSATACSPWQIWPSELTFLAGVLAGTPGSFDNMQDGLYMTSFYSGSGGIVMQPTHLLSGWSTLTDESALVYGYVLPVRDGDIGQAGAVTPVPEPSTYALMLAGLLGLGVHARRRQRVIVAMG